MMLVWIPLLPAHPSTRPELSGPHSRGTPSLAKGSTRFVSAKEQCHAWAKTNPSTPHCTDSGNPKLETLQKKPHNDTRRESKDLRSPFIRHISLSTPPAPRPRGEAPTSTQHPTCRSSLLDLFSPALGPVSLWRYERKVSLALGFRVGRASGLKGVLWGWRFVQSGFGVESLGVSWVWGSGRACAILIRTRHRSLLSDGAHGGWI